MTNSGTLDTLGLITLTLWDLLLVLTILLAAHALILATRWTIRRAAEQASPRWRLTIFRVIPILRLVIWAGAIAIIVPILVEPTFRNIVAVVASLGLALAFALKDYGSSLIGAAQQRLAGGAATPENLGSFDALLSRAAVRFVTHLHYGRIAPEAAGFELPARTADLDVPATVLRLASAPDPAAVAGLEAAAAPYRPDVLRVAGADVYLHIPGGYGVTKLDNAFLERKLGGRATTRNWKTVTTLAAMAAEGA